MDTIREAHELRAPADPEGEPGAGRPVGRKPRILFVAEAVTLAHVARPAVLANGLDRGDFDVFFATDPRYNHLFPELSACRHDIWSISSEDFLEALSRGSPLYNEETLTRYVEDDLALIDKISPDLIVGDYRLSLSVSARLRRVPYASITNVYWCVHSSNQYTVPELPMTRLLGVPLSQFFFKLSRPLIFALHCIPLNRVRRQYGLKSLGHDLRAVYSDADEVLLADLPDLFPISAGATGHRYIGPLPWSPRGQPPSWWHDLDRSQPVVYVTLGSSGRLELLPIVLEALAHLPVTVVAATAGRGQPDSVPDNALVADYLPGDQAAQLASLVVCNGGSLTTYQALAHGTPVLGIAGNLDQHLNMSYLSRAGIGEVIRSEQAGVEQIRDAVERLLDKRGYNEPSEKAKQLMNECQPQQRFLGFVQETLSTAR